MRLQDYMMFYSVKLNVKLIKFCAVFCGLELYVVNNGEMYPNIFTLVYFLTWYFSQVRFFQGV